MSQFFESGGQNTRASISALVLPMNVQGWFPLGLTGLISLWSKELSRVFSSTTVRKHQFFVAQPSLWSNSHICPWLLEEPKLWLYGPFWQNDTSAFKYVCYSFPSKEQASFNSMAAVTVCSHFGAQDNKICHCFHFFPSIYCEDWMTWSWVFNVEFQASFFTLLFHPHQEYHCAQ